MILYNTAPFRRLHQGPLPISHRSTLRWIGFTKEGLVASYDSQCVIRVLSGVIIPTEEVLFDEMEWVVLMNVKFYLKEKQEIGEALPYCWIVALSLQTVKYILLPSAASIPPTLPRPILSILDVKLPLCVGDENVSHLQKKGNVMAEFENSLLLRTYEFSAASQSPLWESEQHREQIDFDKFLLRQINIEIGSNQLLRAEYLCSLINTIAALKKAAIVGQSEQTEVQLAQKANVSALVSRIEELMDKKQDPEPYSRDIREEKTLAFEDRLNSATVNSRK